MSLNPVEGLALFTDGSSDNNGDRSGGWAWIALDAYEGICSDSGFASDVTNNKMELRAISEGLGKLFTDYGSCDVLIYSDSEYVVKGVNNNHNRRKNQEEWHELDVAVGLHKMGYKEVIFEHVKGHGNNVYNAMADDLAGKARKRGIESRAERTNV